jgi:tRNA threonylcarbamoyladenosine biosynthesis protein TsaE
MSKLSLLSRSSSETEELGQLFGSVLVRGTFVALRGDLGSGKTCFTRGVVVSAAPESAHLVASPTYAIMNEYPGITPVYHFDFYRLTSCNEIAELGFEEYFMGDGICIAEWSERLDTLLRQDHLSVTFEHTGDNLRRLTFEADGPGAEILLARFAGLVELNKKTPVTADEQDNYG